MLLALFLIDLAAGLVLFLPLVGRRNAGPKFYRLVMVIAGVLIGGGAISHLLARRSDLARLDLIAIALAVWVLTMLRYPKRLAFRIPAALFGAALFAVSLVAYDAAVHPSSLPWTIAGVIASVGILGATTLAMTLGHWYLVVRGMSIDPLKRLTIAILIATIIRIIVVSAAFALGPSEVVHEIAVRQGIFFGMRALWGLAGPLFLYPMIWGTVRIRSTMAATGILYVAVVAVVIGEVLGAWLSAIAHLPV